MQARSDLRGQLPYWRWSALEDYFHGLRCSTGACFGDCNALGATGSARQRPGLPSKISPSARSSGSSIPPGAAKIV